MPRNTKKLSELETQLNKKDLEIAKYKQLVSSIQGLITINGLKPSEDDYIDLLSDLPRDRKAETYKLSTDELAQALTARLKKDGLKLFITKEKDDKAQETINKAVNKTFQKKTDIKGDWEEEKLTERGEKPQPQPRTETKTHVDELKEHLETSEDEYPKPSKIKKKGKTPTNISDILEQERANATEATATASQNKTLEEHIKDLPPEAKARIQANNARARAAEKEKWHGEEGDREYERLTKKEKVETGELPATGECPHCGEKLEAPIIRGYHDICWEAKNKRQN